MTRTPDSTPSAHPAHTPHATPRSSERAPLTNSEFCALLVSSDRLTQCSPSLLRRFLGIVKPAIEAARPGLDLRDRDQKLTAFAQEAVELFLDLDRDADAFQAKLWQQLDYSPLATAAPTAPPVSFEREIDRLFGIDCVDLEIPEIDVEVIDLDAIDTTSFDTALATYDADNRHYGQIATSADAALRQLRTTRDKALEKEAVEEAVRDFKKKQAIKKRTMAALEAQYGI